MPIAIDHPTLSRLARGVGLLAVLLVMALPGRAAEQVEGYEYILNEAKPSADAFDADPDSFRRVTSRHVRQGPRHTAMWRDANDRGLDKASFARGERRMGLFVPFWDAGRTASEESGWESYGRSVSYRTFEVEVERGDRDRGIDGRDTHHYTVRARVSARTGDDGAYNRTEMTSDVWVLADAPFSFAPFATAGVYGDPRLSVALAERIGELGLVMRVETTYVEQPQAEDGGMLGHPREGAHLAWVSDLRATAVEPLDLPTADRATLDRLRKASREAPEATCETVLAGETPEFVRAELDGAARAAFVAQLAERCERRRQRNR